MQLKKFINPQYLYPVVVFFFLSLAYFVVPLSEGKKLRQGDIINFRGMSKEIQDFRDKYHKEPLWTNSMFGGMPAYLISTEYKDNLMRKVHNLLTLYDFRPVSFIFLYLLGFYIALLLLGVKPWLSFAGAIAYAFSSYFFIIIEAGHVSKVIALGYMPPIIIGVYTAFRGKALLGSLVAGLFLALQLIVNHLQITYYTFLIILILLIFEFISAIRNKELLGFFKPVPWLILFLLLAVGTNFGSLLTTYEYGKYSIRGKSELSVNKENKTSGLDKDYATQWSYGIGESITLLIPNFKGGPSSGAFGENSKSFEFVKDAQGLTRAKQALKSLPSYWGDQPFTSGPVYVGAVVCFLFLLGLFLVKGPVKWWLFAVTIFSIMLAWGSNFPVLTNFMLDHFPGYNKFRTVSMALVMAEFSMPLLAILTFRQILESPMDKKEFLKKWKYSFFGLGGFILLLIIIAGSFDFHSLVDDQYIAQGGSDFIDAVRQDRLSILRADAFRSLIYVALTAGLIYFVFIKKIKPVTATMLLALLFLLDMWTIDNRYLNHDNFVSKKEDKNPFTPTTADLLILKDKDPDYRVLNLTVSTFNDASTSYFHKSIGGYHGAKMRRYQELIDHQLQPEISNIIQTLRKSPTPASVDSVLEKQPVLKMLNTRYIIYNPDAPPLVNKNECGNAWFVHGYRLVNNADEEMQALAGFYPDSIAVIDKRFQKELNGFAPRSDSSARIKLSEYRANYLKYISTSESEQLAVFSEIYYDKGWQAYIDGKPSPYFRADYVLRAMLVPKGNHIIEFKFHPQSYYTGEKVSLASSLIMILLLLGTGWYEWKRIGKDVAAKN